MKKSLLLLAGSMLMSLFAGVHASGETLYDVYNNYLWDQFIYYDGIYGAHNITGDLVGVVGFEKNGVSYLLVRDQGDQGVVLNYTDISQLGSDVKYYNIQGHDQREYSQTNWILLHSGSQELLFYAGQRIQNIKAQGNMNEGSSSLVEGTCDEEAGGAHGKLGILTHRVDYITPGSELATTAINTYCPANFTGSDLVEGIDNGVTSKYFFMKPKQNEFAHIVYAQYNGDDAFVTPAKAPGVNGHDFKGGFKVDWSLYYSGKPDFLKVGEGYEFDAVIFYKPANKTQGVWGIAPGQPWGCGCDCKLCNIYYEHHNTGDCELGWDAPKKTNTVHPHTHGVSVEAEASAVDENGISTEYIVYPVKINKDVIVTAVEEVSAAKQLAQVKYVNLQGQVSATPFAGVNIKVTTYTDGTTSSEKILK